MSAAGHALIRAEDLGQDLEEKVAPNGQYELRLTSATLKTSQKTERQYISFGIQIEGDDYATLWHSVFLPMDKDEPRTRKLMLRDTKRFFSVFGIPLDQDIDEDALIDLVGLEGKCLLKQQEIERDGVKSGDFQNVMVLPRV